LHYIQEVILSDALGQCNLLAQSEPLVSAVICP